MVSHHHLARTEGTNTLTEYEVNRLNKIDKLTFPFGKDAMILDTWRFNWKMLDYLPEWDSMFPVCFPREMVEEILSWCSIWDLRFIFPKLYLNLQIRFSRLNDEGKSLLCSIARYSHRYYNEKLSVFSDLCEYAEKANQLSSYTTRELTRLRVRKEGNTSNLVGQFCNVMLRIFKDKPSTTYEEVVNTLFQEYQDFFIHNEAFILPYLNEIPNFFKATEWTNTVSKVLKIPLRLKKYDSYRTATVYGKHGSLSLWNSPFLYLLKYGSHTEWRHYFEVNKIRYYCRGTFKGYVFPKTWNDKKFRSYLYSYRLL